MVSSEPLGSTPNPTSVLEEMVSRGRKQSEKYPGSAELTSLFRYTAAGIQEIVGPLLLCGSSPEADKDRESLWNN